jgi:hypothetical protein
LPPGTNCGSCCSTDSTAVVDEDSSVSVATVTTGLAADKSRLAMREPVTVTSCNSSCANAGVTAAAAKAATTAALTSEAGAVTRAGTGANTEHTETMRPPFESTWFVIETYQESMWFVIETRRRWR